MKPIKYLLMAVAFAALTACGGGDDGYGGDQTATDTTDGDTGGGGGAGNTGTIPEPGTVGSVIISYSNAYAIEDQQNGVYMRKYSVLVRDQDGTPFPNGTRVDLQVVDSIIAHGTLSGASGASGTTFNLDLANPGRLQPDASMDDWSDNTTVALNAATVSRPGIVGGSNRGILAGDLVILTGSLENTPPEATGTIGAIDSRDVARTIATTPTTAGQLTVTDTLNSTYPAYGTTNYYVAASMLGAGVSGEVSSTEFTAGYALTKDDIGVATVWVSYPSSRQYIRSGCIPSWLDTRVSPMGSSRPMLVATVGDIQTVLPVCFNSLAGYSLTATPAELSIPATGTRSTTICARDGGDTLRNVPFWYISVNDTGDTAADVDATPYNDIIPPIDENDTPDDGNGNFYTRLDGCFRLDVTATGATVADTGEVVVNIADGEITIPITIE